MNMGTRRKRVTLTAFALTSVAALTMQVAFLACARESPVTQQPAANQVVDQFQKNGGVFPGYRRNHAKGVCISGYFQSDGDAAPYSVAQLLATGQRTPVVGRFSIPGTNPYAWDGSTPIRGMALDFLQADGQQWRTAMNAVPVFPVSTPADDYEFMQAQQPLPATGNPDPKKLAAFFANHPKANAFRIWDDTTKPSTSFATESYNSLNTFDLVDAKGHRQAVRWSMVPEAMRDSSRAPIDSPDYLNADLHRRLSQGALRWRLMFVLANARDPIDDAAQAWPADRRQINAGTLVIQASEPQNVAVCRDINFDPLVLPNGIKPSNDPLLKFRAQAYAESHRRRIRDETQADNATRAASSAMKP